MPSKAPGTVPPWIIQNNKPTAVQQSMLGGTKVLVGTPMYGGQCSGLFSVATNGLTRQYANLGKANNIDFHFLFNESLVQRGRNAVAHYFMECSDASYLLFIDADIGFIPEQAMELILMAKAKNLKIAGASYSKKQINWDGIKKAMAAGIPDHHLMHCAGSHVLIFDPKHATGNVYEPFPVKYLGTGFMLIHRSAFIDFQKQFPESWYHNNHIPSVENGCKVWNYFQCPVANDVGPTGDPFRVLLSEDYYFCRTLAELEIPIYYAPWILLKHHGSFVYEGCVSCTNGSYIHGIGQKKLDTPPQKPHNKKGRGTKE